MKFFLDLVLSTKKDMRVLTDAIRKRADYSISATHESNTGQYSIQLAFGDAGIAKVVQTASMLKCLCTGIKDTKCFVLG